MGRSEQPLDRDGTPARELAYWLRDLRTSAALTYAELAKRSGYSISTLQEAAAGRRLPTKAVTLAFVGACKGDQDAWEAYWIQIRRATDSSTSDDGHDVIPPWATAPVLISQQSGFTETAAAPAILVPDVSLEEMPPNTLDAPTLSRSAKEGDRPWWKRRQWRLAIAIVAVLGVAVVSVLALSLHHKATRDFASVTVQNKVAFGPDKLAEDTTPVYLSTETISRCGARGCKLANTDMWSGAKLVVTCWTRGELLTNADETSPGVSRNKNAAHSDLWYQAMWKDGRRGYISEVYVAPRYRGGLDLKRC